MTQPKILTLAIALALAAGGTLAEDKAKDETTQAKEAETKHRVDEVIEVTDRRIRQEAALTNPSTEVTALEAQSINMTTVEDFVRYEPSLVVRRRYIGDSNGTLGIRGANMFQTARSMVFADDLPLHSLLQTQYNGAPRWSLVSADETASVQVIYGPFSAQYSGNAMGGVVDIQTEMPEQREFKLEANGFSQSFNYLGADDDYTGHREFLSYGDKLGDTALYLFHNHLDNDGQPMTFRSRKISGSGGPEVLGAYVTPNNVGEDVVWVGDTGAADSTTDLTKFKASHEFGEWSALATVAFENRDWTTNPNNYLTDPLTGLPVWSGGASFQGYNFSVNPGDYAISEQNRRSLLVGLGVEGPVGGDWNMDVDVSYFDIMKDENRASKVSPLDPSYTPEGSINDWDDTGWQTLEVAFSNAQLASRDDMTLTLGYHYDGASMEINQYQSDNWRAGDKTSETSSSGGNTRTQALYAQWGWDFAPRWDVSLGARYELWETYDSHYYKYGGDMEDYADRDEDGFSPKLAVGFAPTDDWSLRYSLAKAYRFPIVEELYANEEKTTGTTIADANLGPEIGLHHNLTIEKQIPGGFVRANLYHEVVEDAIWNQTDIAANITTFLPVDEVTTSGAELIIEQDRIFDLDVDLRFNVAYTDSEITENAADPSVVGNVFPRMPEWRSGLLAIWHVLPQLDGSLGFRYASDSYGNLDNSDHQDQVYGAQDEYLFVDVKANYQISERAKVGFGVDNLTDELAFVAHPWPGRTFYLEASIGF